MSTIHKISGKASNQLKQAEKYYRIIALLNDIHITPLQAKILGWMGVTNYINGAAKKSFAEIYKTTISTVDNQIGKLLKTKMLVNEDGKIRVSPYLQKQFPNPFEFNISLSYGN